MMGVRWLVGSRQTRKTICFLNFTVKQIQKEMRKLPKISQYSQVVLFDPLFSAANKPHFTVLQVLISTIIIIQCAVQTCYRKQSHTTCHKKIGMQKQYFLVATGNFRPTLLLVLFNLFVFTLISHMKTNLSLHGRFEMHITDVLTFLNINIAT